MFWGLKQSFHNCAGNDTLIFCRSESNEKNHHHKDKKQTQSTNAFDSDESMKNDFKQTSDASTGKSNLCQIMFDDIGLIVPKNFHCKYEFNKFLYFYHDD